MGSVLGPRPALATQPVPPGPQASNINALMGGVQLAQTATPSRYAAPTLAAGPAAGAGEAPSVEAMPEDGWGTGAPGAVGYGGGTFAAAAPPPPPAQPPAQTQPPAQQPPPAAVATGVNSLQYQQALELNRRATALETQFPYSPAVKAQAAGLRARAQLLMQADSVVQGPGGVQIHTLTGKQDDPAKPLPNYRFDPNAGGGVGAYVDTTGTNKPEFAPAQRDAAVAQKDVMELGPLVASGRATPEQKARYDIAAITYQQPVLKENPVTKETVRVNTRELPPGFPQPTGLGGGGPGGAASSGGSNVVIPGYSPAQQQIERDKGRYDIAVEDLKHDRGEVSAIGDAGRSAQLDNLRVQEMRDILEHATTGPGTETAAQLRAWIARWTPGELSRWDGNAGNLSGPAAIEMFQKLGFVGAVTQERGSTPRGGYQATKLFQQFNPGAQMLTSTNQGLLAQRLIANQAEADYAQAAQDHYNTQRQRLRSPEHDYDPLSSFDAKWQAQRNPQVYAAAIGALGGQDPEMWSRGLSKDEILRVKEVVGRADPNAVIHMPGEGRVVLQPNAKPLPPGFKVQ
jgi:hypothetical protein